MALMDYLGGQVQADPNQPQQLTLAKLLAMLNQDPSGASPSSPAQSAPPLAGAPQAAPQPSMPQPTPLPATPQIPQMAPLQAPPSPVAAPDNPGIMGLLRNPNAARVLLSTGAALMQAGGPSTKQTSLGQALASGVDAGTQASDEGNALAMQKKLQQQTLGASQWTTLTPAQAKAEGLQELPPGYMWQKNGNGEEKPVGEDVFKNATGYDANGYPISQPVDVRHLGSGTATAGGPAGTGTPGAQTNTQKIAHMIATYQMAPLSSFAMKTPMGMATMAAVAAENPNYQANNFTEYQKAYKDFGTGKQGQQVKSFGVAMSHLDTLDQLTDALNNGNVQAVNKVGNFFASQTGQTAPTSFNAAKDVVSQEIIKAVTGASGALGDRESAQKTLDAANSPAQLKQVIATYKQLMAGQLQGLQRQFESSTGRKDFTSAMDLPPSVVSLLGGDSGSASAAAIPSGWSVVAH